MSIYDRRPTLDELLLTPIVIEWQNHLWTNEMLAVATARTPLGKYGSMEHFVAELYFDHEDWCRSIAMENARHQFDFGLRPWARPDRVPLPYFQVFGGRLGRFLEWISR